VFPILCKAYLDKHYLPVSLYLRHSCLRFDLHWTLTTGDRSRELVSFLGIVLDHDLFNI
jgi:hypothetical protein